MSTAKPTSSPRPKVETRPAPARGATARASNFSAQTEASRAAVAPRGLGHGASPEPPPLPRLGDEVQFVRGVGPARAREFASLGVRTLRDLLEHLPFRYDHQPRSTPIGTLGALGEPATLVGEVRRVRARASAKGPLIQAELVDGTGKCMIRWFNAPHLRETVVHGAVLRVSGKVESAGAWPGMTNPVTSSVDPHDPFAQDREQFVPVYRATGGLASSAIRRIILAIVQDVSTQVLEPLPEALRRVRRLPLRRTAILRAHEPLSAQDAESARRRLAYDELLLMQLAVAMRRRRLAQRTSAPVLNTTPLIDERIRKRLPFALTAGQEHVIAEIRADLQRSRPMNRLLQGDVGAGKTAVAVYAALSTVANRHQVALLAPTEVLARQHFQRVNAYLSGSRVRTELLVGSIDRARRGAALAGLKSGAFDWAIGTHALLEGDVAFKRLGLLVIDEQQRFGVAQRAALRAKGASPHVLVLTATPIPRTLAMTVFGDLDVSTIRDLPPGRAPVRTELVGSGAHEEFWRAMRERLSAGEQAYIVYPLVDPSEQLPLKSVSQEARRLAQGPLRNLRLAALHGRMPSVEKQRVLNEFRAGRLAALVSTTVIEVGVDVPQATLMIIEHAERFGLSQLHQLRGRVGRGGKPGSCYLLPGVGGGPALDRLRILCETRDGFRIAEEDFRLRGPGDLVGTRQHGLPLFRIADLGRDLDLLMLARDDAAAILDRDPKGETPELAPLYRELRARHPDALSSGEAS